MVEGIQCVGRLCGCGVRDLACGALCGLAALQCVGVDFKNFVLFNLSRSYN